MQVHSTSQDQASGYRESVLAQLKAATRAAHQSMEAHLDLPSQLKDIARYRRLLEQFLGFFQPLEARLSALPGLSAVIPDLEDRMRGWMLEADLAELGSSSAEIGKVRRCLDLPPVRSASEGLGCLYVLEGSTLGGQLIAHEIAALNEGALRACRFFQSNGDNVGLRWKRFAAAVEAYAADHSLDSAVICDSALQTFRGLEAWIDRCRRAEAEFARV